MANDDKRAPLRLIPGIEEDLLHAFLEHIPDDVYFKDRDSRFVLISRSLASRFGLTHPAQAINKTDFDMFSAEHAQQAFADEQRIVQTGQPVIEKEEKETWPDGRESWVLTTKVPLVDVHGKIIGTMGISRDITERKFAERQLEEYRLQLEDLVAKRTAELAQTNALLEQDIEARKIAEQELASKAEELARANAELENLSLVDHLTGLYNRRGFLALADHATRLAERNGEAFSIVFVDLDGLKEINDRLGHLEGDKALLEAAEVLRASFRTSDILSRFGGDEFAAFVTEADERRIAGRIQEKLDARNAMPNRPYRLSFSTGIVSCHTGEQCDVKRMLGEADALMYQEKRNKGTGRHGPAPGV